MFVDRCKIKVRGGSGGKGCASFRREKYVPLGGPDGGDGGHGGSVILRAVTGQQSLVDLYYMPHYEAKNGEPGRHKDQNGHRGADRVIEVPVGTVLKDAATGELLADLAAVGAEFVAAAGGRGGKGNLHFISSTNRAPRTFGPGEPGEERELLLELKTIAEVGLVGYPNAGKSTLIAAISDAHPKTAPYPFTTRHPVVGVVEFPDFQRFTVADIPGLIDGAHLNRGLGHDFLRHIERCPILVYVLDMAGVDGRNPGEDLLALERELEQYQAGLSRRAALIVANKMDLPAARRNLAALKRRKHRPDLPILEISALHHEHLRKLVNHLRRLLDQAPAPAAAAPGPA
ncbi:MAG: GTPase ObgE [Lentisphaeria bacterium]|jgi:GTP-binding protein